MLIEQTEIARRLGISSKKFRSLMYRHNMQFQLVNNKRHYEWDEVIALIQKGKNE